MPLNLEYNEQFAERHHGLSTAEMSQMLEAIGVASLDELIDKTVPEGIRRKKPMDIPKAQSEKDFLTHFKNIANKNKVFKSFIGMGYYDTITPNVILRNVLENPAWYTAYTPYQAEIAQGRMEALINFQTLVMDLTGMEIANASLLDEGTAAAEAMTMLHGNRKGNRKNANIIFVSHHTHPQTIDVLKTRALPLGIDVLVDDHTKIDLTNENIFALVLPYPASNGEITDYTDMITTAKELGIFVAVTSDLLALTLLTPPSKMGVDVVVGSAQRMGVPMGYGGPHAAFFATKDEFKRQIPGRIIGVSIDSEGNKAYRMALQTREQHIRREKATSNICTAQVLLSVMASMYAVYHGPKGLLQIAEKIYGLTQLTKRGLEKLGFEIENKYHFDTITILLSKNEDIQTIKKAAEKLQFNFRYHQNKIGISFDETKTLEDVQNIFKIFQIVAKTLST
ncbi:MAG: glycine dehydrogenase (aminomethyl-transferring), partial [Cytophagales bacterium]